jgi:hypothetical protein
MAHPSRAVRLLLRDALALAGRLHDQPGPDTARERFRRFLASWPGQVDDVEQLIDDAQRAADDQSQRALMDLVVSLGRYLGFDVTYGGYERRHGAVRFDGAWRSVGLVRAVLEVRTERSRPFSADDLTRAITALQQVDSEIQGEQSLGLCVVVPQKGTRRSTDPTHESSAQPGVRVLSLKVMLKLAACVQAGDLTHAQVVALLLSPDDDRRVTEVALQAPLSTPERLTNPSVVPLAPLVMVSKQEPPDHWIATIPSDEGATPEQFVDAVISGRQLLGVSAIGIFQTDARAGDWVCFYLAGSGVVGHARLAGRMDRAPLRGAERFTAVFTLSDLTLYDVPHPIDGTSPAQRLATRTPFDSSGPFLSAIAEDDFLTLTAALPARSVATPRVYPPHRGEPA